MTTTKPAGFFGIGCLGMKTADNYGTLFRTAHIFGADFIFLIGARFKQQATDTTKASKHMPLYVYRDFQHFQDSRPHGAQLVGIELTKTAVPLIGFEHPKQAIYLLGAEDAGLSQQALQACQHVVILPSNGAQSLNVAVAGSIVLYDRIAKGERR